MIRLCLIGILLAGALHAQTEPPPAEPDSLVSPDSLVAIDTAAAEISPDTIMFIPDLDAEREGRVTDTVNYERRLTQQPTVALFKSMAIPGWGQVGNKRYIKAAIFAGFQTWFISSAIRFGGQASDARDAWSSETNLAERNRLYDIYEDKRGQRNKFTWFAVICSFISMFDAYVDAHLSGSPEHIAGDQVTFEFVPDQYGGAQAVLSLNF
ncbi:hypothetical protein KQH82_05105 [bacterium]|nr:hypothetical protein [bacterium]